MGPGSRFEALDLLRGVAAVAVVALHAPRADDAAPLLPHAYLAVDLFFALSGFVIAHAYWQRLRDGMTVRAFVHERLVRLYPLYLLATLLGALAIWSAAESLDLPQRSPQEWLSALAANLLFVPAAPGPEGPASHLFPFAFPAWSLFWELIANIVFALAATRLSPRMLRWLLALALLFLVATGAIYNSLNVGISWSSPWGGAPRVLWCFFAGVGIYRVYQAVRPTVVVPGWALGALLVCSLLPPLMGWAYDVVLTVLFFPLLILAGSWARSSSSLSRWLAQVSYAVYVLQAPVLLFLFQLSRILFGEKLSAFPLVVTSALLVTVTLAVATFATLYFDEPVRARLRNLLINRREAAALPAS